MHRALAAILILLNATTISLAETKQQAPPQAPGQSEYAPGQRASEPGQAKKYAPGQKAKTPGEAKKYAPGQK
jgi:hypothetical protein